MLELLRRLAMITATPDRGATRLGFTRFEDEAHDVVWDDLAGVPGLERIEDAAGNTFIVPHAARTAGDPIVLIGSHLDTVRTGGWLDGALGVVAGAAVLRARAGDPRFGLVVFRDEEGVRFNTGLFGSKVFGGLATEEDLDRPDDDGVRVRDVVPDPEGCVAYRPPVTPAAYLECHIEQGARLIEAGRRIGIVTGIVGIRRFRLVAEGEANHAGTTEMHRRVDALLPVAAVAARLPAVVDGIPHAVATCGRVDVEPGVPNIVPGRVTAIIEVRATDQPALDHLARRVRELVAGVTPPTPTTRWAPLSLTPMATAPPMAVDPSIVTSLRDVATARGVETLDLPSMAGHDAQHAAHRCPAGMFFIPSRDGVSHTPHEDSDPDDIVLAGDLMTAWATREADRCSSS